MNTAKEIISHISLNMSYIARLTLEATEEPGRQAQGLERSQLLHLLRRVIRAGAEAVRAEDCTVSFAEAAWESVAERKGRRATTLRDLRHFVRRMLREECSHCAKAQACGVSRSAFPATGRNAGEPCEKPQDSPTGSRMCAAIPLPAAMRSISGIWGSCNGRWGTAA